MWAEFFVGSRSCSEGFFRVFRFSSLHKNQHFQIQIRPENSGEKCHFVDVLLKFPFIFLFIYLFIYLFILSFIDTFK